MRYFFQKYGAVGVRMFLIALLWPGIVWPGIAAAFESPGLTLNLYTNPDHPDFKFQLGADAIPLIIVIQNITSKAIDTERGFSSLELYNSVIVTDPTGTKHYLKQGDESHKMPAPYFLNGRPWSLAETLPADWVRSADIDDLRNQVPIMNTTPGWYRIEAYQPFVRFASTGVFPKLGSLGLLDNPANWTETVRSNVMQIFIAPPSGAQVKVQVLDGSEDPPATPGQVPVRVFNNSDITPGFDLAQTWQKIEPVLSGTTDLNGLADWDTDSVCLTEGNYTAVAFYSSRYEKANILSGTGNGWGSECTGSIAKTITFISEEPPPLIPGDLDGDGDVDRDDVQALYPYLNHPAGDYPPGDIDGDGIITILDVRTLMGMCTCPRCMCP